MILIGLGDHHPVVGILKRRLGVYPSDDYFDEELAARVRGAQMSLGLTPDGLVDDDLVSRLHLRSDSLHRTT